MQEHNKSKAQEIRQAREQGFSGGECNACKSYQLKNNGSCMLCLECGETTGCS